jgi:hypothetical protein
MPTLYLFYYWFTSNNFYLFRYQLGYGGWWFDIPWIDNRNIGQSKLLVKKIATLFEDFPNKFHLYDFNSNFVTDLAYFQFNLFNPFNFLELFNLGYLSIFSSTLFGAFLLYLCFKRDLDINLNCKIKFLLFISIFVLPNIAFGGEPNQTILNDKLFYFIYIIFFYRLFNRKAFSKKFYIIVFISSAFLCSILFPVYIFFTYLILLIWSLFKEKISLEFVKNNLFFILLNFFAWSGYVFSNFIANQDVIIKNTNITFSQYFVSDFFFNSFIFGDVFKSSLFGDIFQSQLNYFPLGLFLFSFFIFLSKNIEIKKLNNYIIFIIFITLLINYFVNTELFYYLTSSFKIIRNFVSYPFVFINFFIIINVIFFLKNNKNRLDLIFLIFLFIIDLTILIGSNNEILAYYNIEKKINFFSHNYLSNLSILIIIIQYYLLIFSYLYSKKLFSLLLIIFFLTLPLTQKINYFSDLIYSFKNISFQIKNKKTYNSFEKCFKKNIYSSEEKHRVLVTGYSKKKTDKEVYRLLLAYTQELHENSNLDFVYKYREKKRVNFSKMYGDLGFPYSLNYLDDMSFFKEKNIEYVFVTSDDLNDFEQKFQNHFTKLGTCYSDFVIADNIFEKNTVKIFKINFDNSPFQYLSDKNIRTNLAKNKIKENHWTIPSNVYKNNDIIYNVFINYPMYNNQPFEKIKVLINDKVYSSTNSFYNKNGFIFNLKANDTLQIIYRNYSHIIFIVISLMSYVVLTFCLSIKIINFLLKLRKKCTLNLE